MLKVVLASAILASASAFAPSGMPSGSRIMHHSATAARVSPLGTPVVGGRSPVRAASLALRAAEDADLALFSGLESAEFDGGLSQTDHIAVSGTKATKTTDDTPAFAIFGSGKSSGVEKVSVKVVKQKGCMFIGACALPRAPQAPGYADSLRSWAVMAKESGSIYRTGVLGTKLTEYLGKEIKKTQMAGSYPPKFGDNDMVHMELNHDAGTFKMSINEGEPWEVPSKAGARFFVNMEGKDCEVELVKN